jgi:hypothetical protein
VTDNFCRIMKSFFCGPGELGLLPVGTWVEEGWRGGSGSLLYLKHEGIKGELVVVYDPC